jgi:integrating conjugative element protein (TIGR03749 family)/integrating conjugative element protein (TIGR03746 family)
MSRFKNEIAHLQAHIKTLRLGAGALVIVALVMGGGWWSAPRDLTIHVPPDLRSGSTRKWWEVPPESVYAFTFYVFQTLNRWPTNGEEDYPRNLHTLSPYLTPSCQAFLRADYDYRRSTGELRQRVRGIYEIPGRGYGDDPTARVRTVSDRDWVVTLDITADEYYGAGAGQARPGALPGEGHQGGHRPRTQPLRPGARLLRRHAPAHQHPGADAPGIRRSVSASASRRKYPMKHPVLALLGLLAVAAFPAAQAVEILRWERMPLAVPLKVGQERIVFIDRNVRVGVPAGVGERLRVQSAGGAVYLRASEPIEPTRLQLQDADTGRADPAGHRGRGAQGRRSRTGAGAHRRGCSTPARYGDQSNGAEAPARAQDQSGARPARRETPIPVVLTRFAAQSLYAPLRTVEPLPGVMRINLRRDMDLGTLMPTLPVRALALASWRLEDQWVTAVRLTNTSAGWVTLDPRVLQGDFLTATFQHEALGPHGVPEDTTVLYLVTRGHGLAQSLLPAIHRFDPAVHLPQPEAEATERKEARSCAVTDS